VGISGEWEKAGERRREKVKISAHPLSAKKSNLKKGERVSKLDHFRKKGCLTRLVTIF